MASAGPLATGLSANDASIGTTAWATPSNLSVSDDFRATNVMGSAGVQSNYIKCTTFSFSIPSGATIDGIVVEFEKAYNGAANPCKDNAVRIVKGGTIGSTDRSNGSNWTTTDTIISHGSSSDLWGETWTDSDINATGFGAALSAVAVGGVSQGLVDFCRITVYYTAAASGQPMALRQSQMRQGFARVGRGF